MTIWEIIILGIGLSMDACAVSMTNGMNERKMKLSKILLIAGLFGLFQGLMPLLGYGLGSIFVEFISKIDHWIALLLLGFLGGQMIFESFSNNSETENFKSLTIKILIVQAIATSVDALAVGISFASLKVNIIEAVLCIAITTFVLSIIAVIIGKKFGLLLKNKAAILGGIILIAIGIKIFVEHMI